MEKLHTDLERVLKALGHSPYVIVKLDKRANQVELEIPYYSVKGFAETVYNRIKEAIS